MTSPQALLQTLLAEEQEHLRKLDACRADIAFLRGEAVGEDPVPAAAWLKEDLGSFQWLLHGLLARESVGLLASDAGIGKTTLLAQMTISLATGKPFLGSAVHQPIPTLTIAAEGSRLAFRNRFEATCKSMNVVPSSLNWYVQPDKMTDYMIGSGGLESLIAKSRAQLVILDTLGYFHKGDENDANDWKRNVMQPLRGLINRHGCSFLLVHHHSKGADRQGWQKGRGTTAMYADCDLWLRLEKPEGAPDSYRELWVDKNKYAGMGYKTDLDFHSIEAYFSVR